MIEDFQDQIKILEAKLITKESLMDIKKKLEKEIEKLNGDNMKLMIEVIIFYYGKINYLNALNEQFSLFDYKSFFLLIN